MKKRIVFRKKRILFKPILDVKRNHIIFKRLPDSLMMNNGNYFACIQSRVETKNNHINIFLYGRKKSLNEIKTGSFIKGDVVIIEAITPTHEAFDTVHILVKEKDIGHHEGAILSVRKDSFEESCTHSIRTPPQGGTILLEKTKKAV